MGNEGSKAGFTQEEIDALKSETKFTDRELKRLHRRFKKIRRRWIWKFNQE